jgi:D-glycero-D-manno-heptose 1,7-bisphosphate phosphatase
MNRALFLDRDGVVNVDKGYVHKPEDCEFVPGIWDVLQDFDQRNFYIIIITNQAGIARGYYTEQQFQEFMWWMGGEFQRRGIALSHVYHCPDHPTEGIGEYRRENPWRKPEPGMILQAQQDYDLDLGASWLIGDKVSDISAGRAAGVGKLVLLSELSLVRDWRGDNDDVIVVPTLVELRPKLLEIGP